MSRRTDKEFLSDIPEAIRRVKAYTIGMSYQAFLADTKTQDAVVRNLEIIGEATRGVSPDARERRQTVPWKSMAGVRDRLIHHYFGVNLDVVWKIVSSELEEVAFDVEELLKELKDE